MLYLYAVLASPPPEKPLPCGIGDVQPVFIEAAGLACVVSETRMKPVPPDVENVLRHQEVVEAAMRSGPALPLRFGTLVEDDEVCRRVLQRQAPAACAVIAQIKGCVELALRVTGLTDFPSPLETIAGDGRGAAYLKSLARRQLGWPASNETFPHDRLKTHAVNHLLWPRASGEPILRASYLVRRTQVPAFLSEVTALQHLCPELRLSCTGPWPPYSFSDPNLWGVPL